MVLLILVISVIGTIHLPEQPSDQRVSDITEDALYSPKLMYAKVYKFVHVMESELNFSTLVHCSDTACSLVLVKASLSEPHTIQTTSP